MPTVSLPVEGLEQIWALFPGARPGTRPRYLPAAPAHAAAGLYTDEAYMAPVRDLVRREEALNSSGRSPSGRPSLRCRSTKPLVAGADSPSERPGCAGAGIAQGRNAASSPVDPRRASRDQHRQRGGLDELRQAHPGRLHQ